MAPVALTFAVIHRGGGATEVGWVLGATTLPLLVFLLAGGVLADRFGRRRLMLHADYGRSVVQSALGIAIIVTRPSLAVFIAAELLVGTGEAVYVPSMIGLVPSIASAENLQRANALTSLSWTTGVLVGPAIAGIIVVSASAGWAVLADGLSYLASAVFLTAMRLGPLVRTSAPAFWRDLGTGWREFRSRTWLWAIVAQFFLFHLLIYAPFMVLGAIIAHHALGGAGAWGAILSANGAGSVLGGLIMLRHRPRHPLRFGELAMLGWALPLLALAAKSPTAVVAACAGVAGLGLSCLGTLWDSTMQREIPPELLSRVSSYDWLGSIGSLPIGYVIAGPVASTIGVSRMLTLGAALLCATVALTLATPQIRNLEAPARRAVGATDPHAPVPGTP